MRGSSCCAAPAHTAAWRCTAAVAGAAPLVVAPLSCPVSMSVHTEKQQWAQSVCAGVRVCACMQRAAHLHTCMCASVCKRVCKRVCMDPRQSQQRGCVPLLSCDTSSECNQEPRTNLTWLKPSCCPTSPTAQNSLLNCLLHPNKQTMHYILVTGCLRRAGRAPKKVCGLCIFVLAAFSPFR